MKNTINLLLKTTIFLLVFFFGMFVGEVSQILYSKSDLRDHTLTSWVKENPDKADLSKKFKDECLTGKGKYKEYREEYRRRKIGAPDKDGEKTPLPILTIEKCANENNLGDIYIAIKEADQILHSAPWPLSYLDVEVKVDNK